LEELIEFFVVGRGDSTGTEIKVPDISSTYVRNCVKNNDSSYVDVVHNNIVEYIEEIGLYQ
jgi:hypothetical protein